MPRYGGMPSYDYGSGDGRAPATRYGAAPCLRILEGHPGPSDYDDLILKTIALLRENVDAAWVLFKLDGGLDHI